MNLQQLGYIVAVDRHKSFSKAAEACHVTQATLSTMVRKLEEELEVVLFDRKTVPVITTECGQDIIREAEEVLRHSRKLREVAKEVKGKIEGALSLGIIPTVAANLLHRVLPLLLERYPGLKLNVQEVTTDSIIERLKKGELDVGIASTPLSPAAQLEEEILYYEKLMVYGDTEEGATRFLKPADIANEQVWLLEQGNCLTDQVVNICALHSRPMSTNLSFSPNSFDSLLNIVDRFRGLTIIPELYTMDLPPDRASRIKDFTPPYPVREISLVYHRPYAKMRLISAISGLIKEVVQPLLQTSKMKSSEMQIARL